MNSHNGFIASVVIGDSAQVVEEEISSFLKKRAIRRVPGGGELRKAFLPVIICY